MFIIIDILIGIYFPEIAIILGSFGIISTIPVAIFNATRAEMDPTITMWVSKTFWWSLPLLITGIIKLLFFL